MSRAGEMIRTARRVQQRTTTEVAKSAGLEVGELCLIEAGILTLWSSSAFSLARTLRLDVESLCKAAAVDDSVRR